MIEITTVFEGNELDGAIYDISFKCSWSKDVQKLTGLGQYDLEELYEELKKHLTNKE
jgi:hypothetical protein